MIKSLLFLMKQVWKYQKSYIFYSLFFQFSKLMKPIASIVFPKYIICISEIYHRRINGSTRHGKDFIIHSQPFTVQFLWRFFFRLL